ncbi:MAG: hypothetical protein AAGD32_15345 [Planctomycetota bacterium]
MTADNNQYEPVQRYSSREVEGAIAENDLGKLSNIVIAVSMYATDLQEAESLCARLATHEDENVRGNAILGFGHLARRFGKLNLPNVKEIIESGLQDKSEYVRGQAWAAADDVAHFLGR